MSKKKLSIGLSKLERHELKEINFLKKFDVHHPDDITEVDEIDVVEKPKRRRGRRPKSETINKAAAPGIKEHYVDAKKFKMLIVQYYKDGILGDELAMCLSNIAHRMSYMPNFVNYSYKEEMIGDALIKCFQALKDKKFKPAEGNAFSYYSRVCFNAFINRIKIEKKEHEVIQSYQEQVFNELSNSHMTETITEPEDESGDYD